MYLLQETIFDHPEFPDSLYLRLLNSPSRRDVREGLTTTNSNTCFELFKGEVLSTDTFFGSFYRAYWQRYAPFGQLKVEICFNGKIALRIFEDVSGKVHLRSVVEIEHMKTKMARVGFSTCRHFTEMNPSDDTAGRVFVEVEAIDASVIQSLDFVSSDTAPRRQISLSIGLCTFNQEAYLSRTLKELYDLVAIEPCLKMIFLVNQGKAFRSDAMFEHLKSPRIRLIEQRNLGGCGGFTRTLNEACHADVPTSHHLLMDDDIAIDARFIRRAIRFLSYAKEDIVLGGAMIDAMSPTIMYEAGAFLRPDNTIERNFHGIDLADEKSLYHFGKVTEVDYNAWWFCILPVSRVEEVGLPAPVFIRGDDFEYGQRLADAGVRTVTLPGIAVWHEPFYVKPQGWQTYYDLRNRMIFAAAHPEKVRQLSPINILAILLKPVLGHHYMLARLRLQAISDFLKGPERLFAQDPETIHAGILASSQSDPPVILDQAEWSARPLRKVIPNTRSRPLLALRFIRNLFATGLLARRREETPVFLEIDAHAANTWRRSYVMTNGVRSYHHLFVPDRRRLWKYFGQICLMTIRYTIRVHDASGAWKAGFNLYCRPDYWRRLFQGPISGTDPKTARSTKDQTEANE